MKLTRVFRLGGLALVFCFVPSLRAQAPPPPPPCVAPACWPGKFYKFEVVAQTGDATAAGTLTGLGKEPSINDKGIVAFVGEIGAGNFSGLFTANGTSSPTWVTNSVSTMGITFGDAVQINNNNQIVACSYVLGSPASSSLQIWNGNVPGSSTTVASSGSSGAPLTCLPGLGASALNNSAQPGVVFGALDQASGTVRAFGLNYSGQLGNGSSGSSLPNPAPAQANIPPGVSVKAVMAGFVHSLALDSNGAVWAWGWNAYGQLGLPPVISVPSPGEVSFPRPVTVTAIAAGQTHNLALDSTGTVWAWGSNEFGELGADPTQVQNCTSLYFTRCNFTPVQVSGILGTVVAIAAAGATNNGGETHAHSLALTSDGTVWAWGDDAFGQLGVDPVQTANCSNVTPAVQCRFQPMPVDGISSIKAISAGLAHNLALDSNGIVWAWGANGDGELGNGTSSATGQFTPGYVLDPNDSTKPLTGVVAISATGPAAHNLALKIDGTVWGWGDNAAGQLGVDPNNSQTCNSAIRGKGPCILTPRQVLTGVVAIAAGDSHSLALANDGTVWALGDNASGELGVDPSNTPTCTNSSFTGKCSFIPVRVLDPSDPTGTLSGIGGIAGGNSHSLALHFNQFLATPGVAVQVPPFNELTLTAPVRPAMDDNGNVVVRTGTNKDPNTNPIVLYSNNLSSAVTVADTTLAAGDFLTVGQSPGISRDGAIVAFSGNMSVPGATKWNTNSGPGIFIALLSGGAVSRIIRVAGFATPYLGSGVSCPDPTIKPAPPTGVGKKCIENTYAARLDKQGKPTPNNWDGWCDPGESCTTMSEIEDDVVPGSGFGVNPVGIYFQTFDPAVFPATSEWQNRIGVIHTNFGNGGFDGDSIIVSFLATPNQASRLNLFSASSGLWTVRLDLRQLVVNTLVAHVHKPIPVIQVGDLLGSPSEKVVNLNVYDPIAKAPLTDAFGNARVANPEDRVTALWVSTNLGSQKILRASRLDTDGDGIPDHVELYGMDFNGDGVIDLDLKTLDPSQPPNPNHKDLYLEIDYMCTTVALDGTCTLGAGQHTHNPNTNPVTGNSLGVLVPPTTAVANAFLNAPSPNVTNPDNLPGINLHIIVDEAIPEIPQMVWGSFADNSFDMLKLGMTPCVATPVVGPVGHFGSPADRTSPNCPNIIGARRLVSRYAIFSHQFTSVGIFAPTNLAFSVGPAGSLNGTYRWVVTGLDATGGETFASNEVTGSIVNQQATLTWSPVANATGYNVFRTPVGGLPGTELLVEASVASTSYTDNFTDSRLTAHQLVFPPSGVAKLPGEDFTISLSAGANSSNPCIARADSQDSVQCVASLWGTTFDSEWADVVSSTLMHELGHTLGLYHGGSDTLNFKPNYLSIMNYSYDSNVAASPSINFAPSDCRVIVNPVVGKGFNMCRTGRPLDYSRKALPNLIENALLPSAGIGATPPADYAGYRIVWYVPTGPKPLLRSGFRPVIGSAILPLDWDWSGFTTQGLVTADIDKSGEPETQALVGSEDWSRLQFSFYGSPFFGLGSAIPTSPPPEPSQIDYLSNLTGGPTPVTLVLTLAGAGTGSVGILGGNPNTCLSSCLSYSSDGVTAILTATPAVGSSFAGWSGACTGIGTCTINVTAPGPVNVTATFNAAATCGTIAVTPASLATGTADLAYPAVTFSATGGTGTVTFTESGTLPPGMTFSNGTLSGTPTQAGNFPITITATDSNGCTGTRNYALVVTQTDITPPVTSAIPSPGPNANGWNNTNVTVTLNSTDTEPNGTGVKQIAYIATGAQPIASTVVTGGSTSFTISTEGITTISFFGTDNAGNIEATKTVTIKLDKTPPSVIGSRTPAPNQNGWNNTDVTVSFSCSDSLSGLAPGSPPANTVLSSEAAGQSASGTCMDLAGNSASTRVVNINIDKTPPILTVTSTPLPNSNGWNNTDVTVSFTAVDTLSGVAMVSAPVTVTTEGGGQVVTGSATDLAGNLAVGKVIVNVDKTPPEAFVQFDPVTKDVVLFGRDALSGVAPGPVSPTSVQPVLMDDGDEDNRDAKSKEERRPGDKDSQVEIRTYKVFDLAGNSLVLVENVRKEERQISARILTLQYGDGPLITLPRNQESFEWEVARDGSLRELQQEFRTGRSEEDPRVEASFRSRKNETIILQEEPEPKTKVVKPGLDLLRMATTGGKLTIEF